MMKKIFLKAALPLTLASSCLAEPLALNSPLPPINSVDQNNENVSLGDYSASDWVLVYFYPKADTPGCTKQACSLRDSYEILLKKGVKVFGVSNDTPKEQKAFANKFNLPFTLLADKEAKVIKAFGVPQLPVLGMARRQAFLFHKGKLYWRDLQASTAQQAQEVIAAMDKN